MEKNVKRKIKLEASDGKGMINSNAIREFSNKAEKAICEIEIPNKGFGSGFFCYIPYSENENLLCPVLITCNHVINIDLIYKYKEINIIINGESKTISLKNRKVWTDEKLDFTCIEIKKKEDNINTFYYLDDNVLDYKCSNNCYLNKKVLIFAINKTDKEAGLSNGLIKICYQNEFSYNCNTYPGCSGGCVVNQANNCVIGIHQGEIKDKKLNQGIFIKEIIKYIKDNKAILKDVR